MDNTPRAVLMREHRKLINAAASQTKKCYFIGCEAPTIRAHSISNARLLLKLSDNGHVMYFDKEAAVSGSLIVTGRGKASVFNGFCGEHDKIFLPIDNEDYQVGDSYQEYLFAMRAAAREFNTREAVGASINSRLTSKLATHNGAPAFNEGGREMYEEFKRAFDIGTEDQSSSRSIFNDTFKKKKYHAIQTAIIEIDVELAIAVSSSFNMELDDIGRIINDVSSNGEALSLRMKPCFLTIFPQGGRTYCLISYLKRDRKFYQFLHKLNDLPTLNKQVIVSNLLTSYTENFVANPTFWNNLDPLMSRKYFAIYGNSFKAVYAQFIADPDFNLFPSAK